MTNLRVAGVQMAVSTDVRRNVAAIGRAIRDASAAGADILLTPEGALSGYTPDFDPLVVAAALEEVTALARVQKVGLALGTCFREADGRVYDELRFYAAGGAYLGRHDKILRCGSLTEPVEGEINHYATSELRSFIFLDTVIGGLICNDLWANPQYTPMPDPHLSQQLAARGARIIFHAVNGGRDGGAWSRDVNWHYHDSNLRMRAAAGQVFIVTVDSAEPVTVPCSAPSGVIDPQGEWSCRTEPQGEQLFVCTIELA